MNPTCRLYSWINSQAVELIIEVPNWCIERGIMSGVLLCSCSKGLWRGLGFKGLIRGLFYRLADP